MGPNRSQPPGNPVHAPRASTRERQVCPPSGPIPRTSRTREQNEERQEARGKSQRLQAYSAAKPRLEHKLTAWTILHEGQYTGRRSYKLQESVLQKLLSSGSACWFSIEHSLQETVKQSRYESLVLPTEHLIGPPSAVLRLRSSANGHQGGGAVRSTVLSHHGKPVINTKREYASTLTLTRIPI